MRLCTFYARNIMHLIVLGLACHCWMQHLSGGTRAILETWIVISKSLAHGQIHQTENEKSMSIMAFRHISRHLQRLRQIQCLPHFPQLRHPRQEPGPRFRGI